MKAIQQGNYKVTPFVVHKTQIFQYIHSGSDANQRVFVDLALLPPTSSTWIFNPSTSHINGTSGIYSETLYESVRTLFYSDDNALWNGRDITTEFVPTGSQFYVISLAQKSFGQTVRPSSVIVSSPLYSTGSLVDDGEGRMVALGTTHVVGHVSYAHGLIILPQSVGAAFTSSVVSGRGLFVDSGSQINVQFDSTVTIYEHQALCVMEPGDFNFSSNPSLYSTILSGTGSAASLQYISGTLSPYMTTIGCYDNEGTLVALGRFPKPVKRMSDSQQTVIIRFDA